MGKKGNWLVAVKRAFNPETKENNGQKKRKPKKRWVFGACGKFKPDSRENSVKNDLTPLPPQESIKLDNDQSKHAYSVALASAVAAEAAAVAAQAAAEVVRLTKSTTFVGKSKEENAAIKIQTAFRGYLARRQLRALRGLLRLKTYTNSSAVKRQSAATLRCLNTMEKVQAQIYSRRIRMSEENQALQRQLQLKHERELEKLRMTGEWNDSAQSKEQVEAQLLQKQEAAIRRERALAYAFAHQWKSRSRSSMPTFMDPNNPQWGWSWLERWISTRPWDTQSLITTNDNSPSIKSGARSLSNSEISKAYARRHSPSTPQSKSSSRTALQIRSASPKSTAWPYKEEDSMSVPSIHSERPRRHSIAGSSVRDDDSLGSTMSVPSYMAATESAKAKARCKAALGSQIDVGSAKKRLLFVDEGVRRHSEPSKVDSSGIKI